jgi:hypothetical protein
LKAAGTLAAEVVGVIDGPGGGKIHVTRGER